MPRLLGLNIQNYKSLVDVSLGQVAFRQGYPLPSLSCFIGPNGSGKSSLLDAFGFMADCLREGVEAACDKPQRGGFAKLRSQGRSGPVRFQLYYQESQKSRPITYVFAIDETLGVPAVVEEILLQGRKGSKTGAPYAFLRLRHGEGRVWAGDATEVEEGATSLEIRLDDIGRLGITTLGQLKEHPRIVGLRSYIENWYLSYFVPDAARSLPQADNASPGNLKILAYLSLLEGPKPHPLIGIEEPENGLYHKLVEQLAREFVRRSQQSNDRTQIFVTTHSSCFIDSLRPEQVWFMEKDEKGKTQVRRTADIGAVREMIEEGISLGSLWCSNHFEENMDNSVKVFCA